jgi:chitin disaccharide deacetylase
LRTSVRHSSVTLDRRLPSQRPTPEAERRLVHPRTLVAVSTLPTQPRTIAERLGHPRDAKLLILHADDLGVAHSENAASFDAMDRGAINSGSVMMSTPWVTEVAEYVKRNPNADIGVHLTLTSEWKSYRWGGVAPRDAVPSLYEPDGTFPRTIDVVAKRAKLDEVERELRAQIDLAYAIGIRPTHVDSHMAALFETPELFRIYAEVARSYELPFLHYIEGFSRENHAALAPNDIVPDVVLMALDTGTPERWRRFHLDTIRNLKPGLTEILVHLGYDDAELRAVTVGYDAFGSRWRQEEYDVVTSAELTQALTDNDVVPVTWREIQRAMYPSRSRAPIAPASSPPSRASG